MISDLDCDRCRHCGRLLHKHYGGKRTRELLREWDGDSLGKASWTDGFSP